ncbi:UNVERIFIED_CONTAM: hypothetical protein GTU68_034815 [Idotea baltica]|nr:hypothetical protein [Idotea baltica]
MYWTRCWKSLLPEMAPITVKSR